MKTKLTYLIACLGFCFYTKAQVNIKVKINSVSVASALNCDGGFDNSDFVFEYKVQDNSPALNGNNNPVAGSIGMCNYVEVSDQDGPYALTPSAPGTAVFSPANGVFFDRNYNCKSDVPTSITLTWVAYENDDASAPSVTPVANGTIASQAVTYTVPAANGTYTVQYTQTSTDGTCPQTYMVEFELQKTVGSFSPLTIGFIDGNVICTGASTGEVESSVVGGSGTVLYDWSADGLGDYSNGATESGLSAGVYTLVVKDALGCTDMSTVAVSSVDPPLNINSFSTSSSSVCPNQTGVAYSVPSQTNAVFAWSYSSIGAQMSGTGNSITIDFSNSAMSGTLNVYAQNSCSTTPVLSMPITVLTSPAISISGNNILCDNTQETLTASGGSLYSWNTGANTASISISPTVTTIYSVVVTGTNNCSSTQAYTVDVIASPTLQVTGSTVAVCPNHTVAVSATGNGNLFIWSDGFNGANHAVSAAATSVFTITNIASNSCYTQETFTLNVLPGPDLSVTGNTIVCEGTQVELLADGADSYVWSDGSILNSYKFFPASSTSVTVVGTLLNGCKDSITQIIEVVNTPTVTITGNDTICQGSYATLTASANGTVTYGWNSGANTQTISVSPSGTFTYVVTADNGVCTGTASHELAVKLVPSVDFVVTSPIMCLNDAVYTFTSNPSGGVYSGAGVSGNTFDPSTGVGTYSVTYSIAASNGCLAAQTQTIDVMVCTGLTNRNNNGDVQIFPNPATSNVSIKSDKEIASVFIYDYAGKLLTIIEPNAFETTLNIESLPKGFYMFTITMTDRTQKTAKVFKE